MGPEYLKFSTLDLDTDRPQVYFQNTHVHPRHHRFFDQVLDTEFKPLEHFHGSLSYHPDIVGPSGAKGVYAYRPSQFYSHFSIVWRAHTILAANMPFLENNLVHWIPNRLLPFYYAELDRGIYRDSRIPLIFDEDVYGDADFLALNPAVGYGRLKALDPDETPHPRDVALYETLPNELPRVAGVISMQPQTPLSHVNLRAVQNGIPNAFIRDADEDSDITDLTGSYVRYEVTEEGWDIRAATKEEVDAHYESSRPAETQTPERDLSVTTIKSLREIGFDDWDVFGVKSANLAVLHTLDFPGRTLPYGFAIPFYFYHTFMNETELGEEQLFGKKSAPEDEKFTLAADAKLIDAVTTMLAHPKFQEDFEVQEEMLDDLRDAIKDAESPQWIIDALTAMHGTYPKGQSLRYRSSTNNEDLPNFNGAGLYDSKTQHPDETEEDGIDKSLKQVFAGLWTFRAFSEREFHRVDHMAAAMGVLVHPNYSNELANGVAVSFDTTAEADDEERFDKYYVNTQVGEDLVTNPEVHSVPEEILLHNKTYGWGYYSYTVLGLSNHAEPGQVLMNEIQMRQLRANLAKIHDHFRDLYNPACGEDFAMEIEFKITSHNLLSIKQARPWVFSPAEATKAPTNLTGTVTDDSVTLSWDAPANSTVTGYKVLRLDRAVNELGNYQVLVDDTCSTDTTYTDTDVEADGRYVYRVQARNGDALSGHSYIFHSDPGATREDAVNLGDITGLQETMFPTYTIDGDDEVVQFFSFTLTEPKFVDIALNQMGYDADLALEDEVGKRVRESTASGASNESVGGVLLEGTYYIRVDAVEEGENSYVLRYGVSNPDPMNVEALRLAANHQATGAPTIGGTVQVGETLTATTTDISDDDGLDNVSYSYQWIRNDGTDDDIPGATSSTYTLTSADQGKTIRVRVSFTDDRGNEEVLTSAATGAVSPATEQQRTPNRPATGTPAIIGTAQVGQTLTATTTDISDDDGLENVSYSYRWIRNNGTDDDIPGATSSTYTLTSADQGKTIRVRVSFTDDENNPETLISAATVSVVAAPAPLTASLTSRPASHNGTSTTFTFDMSFSEEPKPGFSYKTLRDDAFRVTGGSVKKAGRLNKPSNIPWRITVAPDGDGDVTIVLPVTTDCEAVGAVCTGDRRKLSSGFSLVVPGHNSPATGTPAIIGTVEVGQTLTATTTDISDDDGLTNVSYNYQWLADDVDISGATSSTYVLTTSEMGKTIRVRVNFTDDRGNVESLTSTSTTAVATAPVPFTVSLEDRPASHDGTGEFTFGIRFSENFRVSLRRLRNSAFTVTGGTIERARRQVPGSSIAWVITVEPNSNDAVRIVLPATTKCKARGALCTDDGRKLSNSLDFTVPGPG